LAPERQQQVGVCKTSLTAAQHPNLTGTTLLISSRFLTATQHPCSEYRAWFSHSTVNNLRAKKENANEH
jgi:hypothetical protein